ncbi:MAG: GNAT family N-acetyltransferase [Chlorobi bacterium]|nr:GNAT family N-acetyltransferase [Chlorobiota bacterium]MCI0715212.1 GNAT family N-acetyltransferase [Chlorobiota bacterium]
MVITYKVNAKIEPHQLAELFESSGIKRPYDDLSRIKKMIDNANLIVTAWDGDKLVGVARAVSDFAYSTYLSDLAVDKEYQRHGIGHELVNEVQKQIGEESNIVLLAAPDSMEYYPKIGFEKCGHAFLIPRKK